MQAFWKVWVRETPGLHDVGPLLSFSSASEQENEARSVHDANAGIRWLGEVCNDRWI